MALTSRGGADKRAVAVRTQEVNPLSTTTHICHILNDQERKRNVRELAEDDLANRLGGASVREYGAVANDRGS